MINKSILRKIVAQGASCFMVLTVMLLLLSCGTSSEGEDLNDGTGNTANQYLQLQPNGLNTIKVSSKEENFVFPFQAKLIGSGTTPGCKFLVKSWSEGELKAYNDREKTTYTLLPPSLYSFTSTEVTLKQGTSVADLEVKLDPSKVFAEYRENRAEYVIALQLSSTEVQVRDRQSNILLGISFDYPTVKMAASLQKVSVSKDLVPVAINTILDYKIGGEEVANPWNFLCGFSVPANAEELVAEYNKTHNSSYQLLPANNYDLGEGASFKVGGSQASGEIIIKREGLAVVDYLLPLKLGESSSDKVICDNEICYLQVGRTYINPIINESAADPTVILSNDGYFYLYATGGNVPVYRSKNLVEWKYIGSAFTAQTRPNWEPMKGRAIWAPEIRYIKNKYVLYYSWAIWGQQDDCHIGVATATSPQGPFTDHGCLINGKEIGVRNSIDQFYIEENGRKYMFWGSFNGIYVTELTDDGLAVKRAVDGTPVLLKKVCGAKFEATCIYKKADYYYLFASVGSCCEGLNSTYRAVVGRSKDLLGPFLDDKGGDMLQNNFKLVVNKNNVWVGPGHNSILIKDDEGTDWMIYHSYKADAVADGRVVLLDRLQWDDKGWPYIRGLEPSTSSLVPVFN